MGLKGTFWILREALVEVMEEMKLSKRGKEGFPKSGKKKRENMEALYERLKTCCGCIIRKRLFFVTFHAGRTKKFMDKLLPENMCGRW